MAFPNQPQFTLHIFNINSAAWVRLMDFWHWQAMVVCMCVRIFFLFLKIIFLFFSFNCIRFYLYRLIDHKLKKSLEIKCSCFDFIIINSLKIFHILFVQVYRLKFNILSIFSPLHLQQFFLARFCEFSTPD